MVPLSLASLSGLMVQIKASDAAQRRQVLEVVLASATEDLKALPYLECASATQYQQVLDTWAAPITEKVVNADERPTATVSDVSFWRRGKATYTTTCGSDDGAQRLTVVARDGDLSATATVVKRDETARVGSSG